MQAIARRLAHGDASAPELALRALFFAACDAAFPGRGHARHAELLLERAVAGAHHQPLPPRLFGGVLTIAWAVHALAAGEELTRDIDAALELELELAGWAAGDHDLISGLAGVGVYALARSSDRLIGLVLERLEANATGAGGGLAWHTPPERIPPEQRAFTPSGHYNAGVAHGAAGIAGLAARAALQGVDRVRAGRLASGAIAWLDSVARAGEATFPCWIPGAPGYSELGAPHGPARSAWCYGDPGIAAQLWAAGRALDQPSLADRAVRLARAALARPADRARIDRNGLCHGAAGFAFLLDRLARASGDARLADGARAWYGRAMQLPPDRADFLTGACGIGLALLAATCEDAPRWSALLLLD